MKKLLSTTILLLLIGFTTITFSGNIVYPWRSTTAIVKSGQTFEVWFNASSDQTVSSVQLKSDFITINTTMTSVNGNWTYDPLSGNKYNKKMTVTVPTNTPADRYDLILNTSSGSEISYGGVKVIKDYKSDYYIMHWSDGHLYQSGYDTDVLLKRKNAMIDIANIIDAEIIIETGDNMYNVRNNPEREGYYFIGNSALGTKGMAKANAATFLIPGDHEGLNANDYSQGTTQQNADFFNDYWGMQNHNFKYGNARFMNLNNAWGLSANSNGVHQYEVDDAKAWLDGAGSGGNFLVTTGHSYDRMHKFINAHKPLDLVLAGDKHHSGPSNPWEITPGGPAIAYIVNSIRDHFEFNIFKVNNATGAFTKPAGNTAMVSVINSGNQDTPSTWIPNLKLTFSKANNGTNATNTATIVNKFDFPIANAKVRFVVPKGNTYSITNGTKVQEFDGTSVHVYDVTVNLAANSPTVVSIGIASTTAVTGVTLTPATASLYTGSTLQLLATVAPANATNKTVSWSSNNSSVATVNSSGLVTAIAAGTASITVTTQDGGKTDTSVITVNTSPTGMQVLQAEDATLSGAIIETNQTGYNGTGFADFVNTSGDFVQWTVNVGSAGSYDLAFRYALPSGGRPLELKVNGSVKVASFDFPATGLWSTWEIISTTQTLNAGDNTIRLTSIGSSGGNFDELTVSAPVTGVTVTPSTATLAAGSAQQLSTAVAPSNATNKTVSWSTSNSSVATVNSSGLVTAVASGTATITATTQDGGKTDTSVITVTAPSGGIQILQAEDATLSGAIIETNQLGYNGTGFADFVNTSSDYVQWTVNVGSAGSYDLAFRYALPSGGRPLELKVNGSVIVASLDFPATGLWSTWETISIIQTLNAGNNTIRLTSIGSSGGNIDELVVTPMNYLDDCNATTGWNTSAALYTADKKEGTGCLQYVGTSTSEFSKTFSPVFNSGIPAANASLKFWYYVSDVTKFNSSNQVELGSGGAADVSEYNWSLTNLVNGWNRIDLKISSANVTGGTPDLAAINWFRIYHQKNGSVTTRVDAIEISGITTSSKSSQVVTYLENEEDKAELNIYPNPVSSILYIGGASEPSDVIVKNISGQTVLKTKTAGSIDVSSLVRGVYFLSTGANKPVRFIKK